MNSYAESVTGLKAPKEITMSENNRITVSGAGQQSGEPLHVEIRCVIPPSQTQLDSICAFLKKEYHADELECSVLQDPSLIEGFAIYVGDRVYDWSAAGRARQLQEALHSMPDEYDTGKVISLLRESIENFSLDADPVQTGTVLSIGDSISVIKGIYDIEFGEIVVFEDGTKGMAQDIRTDGTTGVVLFGDCSEISEGSRVVRTHRTAGIPIGNELLGRIINPLGEPVDGREPLRASKQYPIEYPAPGIIRRSSVNRPLETGILAIDSMFPIGRGQRELIIGDRQTGKTSIAVDTILNQKGKNVVCVYVAIGQKASSVAKVVSILEQNDAMSYTVVVTSPASDPASLQYIAPFSGCSIAEFFMYHGKDALIIYDDLSKHAVAYRTLSLLLERSPGREAYPGDIFYLHSRLLERSAQLSPAEGGGSMTALPIVETQAGDVSAYIPTNVISITDGQLFLESELFFSGQRPAVNVGLSVSRVGGAAQTKIMKKSVGTIRLDLAQYREMKVFSQFGGDLDGQTVSDLKYGAGLMMLLRQPNHKPMAMWEQVVTLICARERMFADIPENQVKKYQTELLSYFSNTHPELIRAIESGKQSYDTVKDSVVDAARGFFKART